jgi:hypothetical protein
VTEHSLPSATDRALPLHAYISHAQPGAGLHVGNGIDRRRGLLLSFLQLNAHPASNALAALVHVGSDGHVDASSETRAFRAMKGDRGAIAVLVLPRKWDARDCSCALGTGNSRFPTYRV